MACRCPKTRLVGSVLSCALVSVVLVIPSDGSARSPFSTPQKLLLFQKSEKSLGGAPSHISELTPVKGPLALPKCGVVRSPEALLTPDPLLYFPEDSPKVRVSFIIGPEGLVHSAFVLESGSRTEEETILRALRLWRYRPALCNGVPTDSEAVIRFVAQ